jgi:hypothetical protein
MQNDLDANYPERDIQILGVNEAGYESGNDVITSGRDIPWLQDVDGDDDGQSDVWTSWDVTYRDVIIADAENVYVQAFDFTTHNLQDPENYDTLLQTLLDTHQLPCPIDLDDDGIVGPADLAFVLGSWGPCEGCPADFNGDGQVNAFDLAQVLGSWGLCPCCTPD